MYVLCAVLSACAIGDAHRFRAPRASGNDSSIRAAHSSGAEATVRANVSAVPYGVRPHEPAPTRKCHAIAANTAAIRSICCMTVQPEYEGFDGPLQSVVYPTGFRVVLWSEEE